MLQCAFYCAKWPPDNETNKAMDLTEMAGAIPVDHLYVIQRKENMSDFAT